MISIWAQPALKTSKKGHIKRHGSEEGICSRGTAAKRGAGTDGATLRRLGA